MEKFELSELNRYTDEQLVEFLGMVSIPGCGKNGSTRDRTTRDAIRAEQVRRNMPKPGVPRRLLITAAIASVIAVIIAFANYWKPPVMANDKQQLPRDLVSRIDLSNSRARDITINQGNLDNRKIGQKLVESEEDSSKQDDWKIFIECHMSRLPSDLSPSGRMYALQLHPLPAENGGGGLVEIFAGEDKKINWGELYKGVPSSYKCEVINYANKPLFNLEFSLNLRFREAIKKATSTEGGKIILVREWLVPISKIDPGTKSSFEFYIMNSSKHFAEVILPSSANIYSKAENMRIRITVAGTSPEAMHFPPSDMS